MKRLLLALCLGVFASPLFAQVQSPDAFLGYELGTHFSSHQKVVDYFKDVASKAKNVKLQSYGTTYEGRELLYAVVSDAANMERLEEIRKNNIAISDNNRTIKPAKQPAIVWLSYNVHGNEANSTETAMKVLYTLVEAKDEKIKQWLKNTVVIIDPCLNPDGRERYVNFYNSVAGAVPDADPTSREHYEPWPGGRTNHYYFDLYRDWAWQTQMESEQRLRQYHQWLPQIHVDFHEQGYNEPYYFAPAAEPIHQAVTSWQREFQVIVGRNNAKYFDENGWQYFTKERFDLLYPSYGDTYPLYNGAIGMTYEQAGSGRAGLAVVTATGDTLTLKDRILHHFTTSMSTIEVASAHAEKLMLEFRKFFEQSLTSATTYKSYVVKAQNISRLRKLAELLTKNKIGFAFGAEKLERTLSGYNYESQKVEQFKLERNDMVISVAQKHGVLANILFEPQTYVTDSNTYDITAWALPYAYGLNAYALKENVIGTHSFIEQPKRNATSTNKPYAWILSWNGTDDAKVLMALQQQEVKVRLAEQTFTIGGITYKAGTLLIYRAENEKRKPNFQGQLEKTLINLNADFKTLNSGYVEKGKDFGSSVYRLLSAPKVAVLSGAEVSSQSLGEIWHFFEKELKYPISMINVNTIANLDVNKVNTLIVPDGYYNDKLADQLTAWVNAGGKLILLEDAIAAFVGKKPYQIKRKEEPKSTDTKSAQQYSARDHDDFSNTIPGAIYKVYLDQTHPLSFGIGKYYFTLKTDANIYEPLESGYNLGSLKADSYIAGVAGAKVKSKISSGMLYAAQEIGKGQVLYFGTGLIFRNFWEGGKQVLLNGVFLG
ncbi:MAG: M14 metallopeptidase family protein [Pedobacter sp.]